MLPKKQKRSYYKEHWHSELDLILDILLKRLTEVREITDSWMVDYNYERPHESLNDLPPKEYERLDQESSL
jgi:putative transposase